MKNSYVGLIVFIVGLALVIYSIISIKSYQEKDKKYIETKAIVVDYDLKEKDDKVIDEGSDIGSPDLGILPNSNYLKAIIAEYEVDGQKYQIKSSEYSNNPKKIGTEVYIKYDPDNPSKAIWKDDKSNIILLIVGGLFTFLGIIAMINSKSNKN